MAVTDWPGISSFLYHRYKKTIENSMAVILYITRNGYEYYCAALSCAASLDTFLEAAFLWIVPLDANCMIFF